LGKVGGGVVVSLFSVLDTFKKPGPDELSIELTRDRAPERHDCTMCSSSAEKVWIDFPFAKLEMK
jgi:hypothetical protein